MKKILIILSMCVCINIFANQNFTDPLLIKAQQLAIKNWNLVPGEMSAITHSKGKNEIVKEETLTKVKYEQKGSIVKALLLEATGNGKPVNEDQRSVKMLMKKDMTPVNKSLFHNSEFPVTFKKISKSEIVNKKDCAIYEYSRDVKNKEDVRKEVGKIWIENETGIPVKRELTLDPLPKKMKEMYTIIYYSIDNNNNWIISETDYLLKVKVMLMSFHIENKIKYSNYWRFNNAPK